MEVKPIAHFTEKDVWAYIKKYNLPYCLLYDSGYTAIDCMPCTSAPGTLRDPLDKEREKQALVEDFEASGISDVQ